jgi:hypothetical protein
MFKKWLDKIKNKDLLIILAIIFLNVLPRLIYIFNNGFFIDGDEAILGTVIQDFLNHHHLQLFLYGQNYGFVLFEVLWSSIISYFFGINIFSMKIAMLLFWLASMVILYYIGKKIFISRRWAILAVFLVSFMPVWFDWATKARIGYLTALLLSNIIILLTLSKKNTIRIITIGLSLIFIYYAQPLYLVIVAPFIIYYFFKGFSFKYSAIFVTSLLVSGAAFYFLLLDIGFNYQLQNKLGFNQIIRNIEHIFSYYSVAYSGRFFDAAALSANYATTTDSAIFIVILLLVIIYDSYLVVKKKIGKIDTLFLFSVLIYIFFMLFYNGEEYPYRYLLPIFIPSVLLIILAIRQLPKPKLKKNLYIFLTIYTIFSLFCGIYSYNFVFPPINDGHTEVERIEYLGNFLHANNIKCVYALDWIISQHINYFVPDLSVRSQEIDPRRPQDSVMVDSEQRSNECALVGLWYQVSSFTSLYKLKDIYIISNRYIVYLRPQREDLLRLNFKLTD